jgi:CRP-like cAMP-binding protein
MFDRLINEIKKDSDNWEKIRDSFIVREITPKTILLNEGEIATHIFFVKKGCLRQWLNKDGKDITTQFFFEGQAVASIESFMDNEPSLFGIESLEASRIVLVTKNVFEELLHTNQTLKDGFQEYIFQRFKNYSQLFISRIKDTPRERYEDLIRNYPEIVKRIPQHYIASYLGITPISLSRIRNRK